MGRNTGGVYTLPGAAFVSGTVISSTAMNAKLADIAAALTDSLSRSGDGDMTAELRVPDGSAALPTLSWTNDPGTGFYLAATSTFRAVILAATVQEWTSTGVSIQKPLTVTTSITNTAGVTSTGNGSGAGIYATGGASSGPGVIGLATGAIPSGSTALGNGGLFLGGDASTVTAISTNAGLYSIGGNSSSSGAGGHGVVGRGGAPSAANGGVGAVFLGGVPTAGNFNGGNGVNGIGAAPSGSGSPGVGGQFTAGATSTGSARYVATMLVDGDLSLVGVANPASTTALSNTVTPANFDKAWAYVRSDGAGGAILEDGFNIASVGIVGTAIQVTFATAFSGINYAPTLSHLGASPRGLWFSGMTTTSILLNVSDMAGVTTDLSTTAIILMFRATGKQ